MKIAGLSSALAAVLASWKLPIAVLPRPKDEVDPENETVG
jgi:hypothetical protein